MATLKSFLLLGQARIPALLVLRVFSFLSQSSSHSGMAEEKSTEDLHPEEEADIHFKPIVQLEKVDVNTNEDEEDEVLKIRAKLFRFDNTEETPEWKERGIGDMRILKHKSKPNARLVMRREKTLKICCNHYLTKAMQLKAHSNSDRAFVWSTLADFADEEAKPELLAIRFRNSEDAEKFKSKFEECQKYLPSIASTEDEASKDDSPSTKEKNNDENKENEDDKEVTDKLTSLKVSDENSQNTGSEPKEQSE